MSDDAAERITVGLAKLSLFLRQEAWQGATKQGLTPTQAQILALLLEHGPLGNKAIAEKIGVTAPTVTDSTQALERKGLIHRRNAPEDGRRVTVMLTPKGRNEAKQTREWPDAIVAVTSILSPAEKAAFLRTITKLIRSLQVRGQISPMGLCVTCQYFQAHAYEDPLAPHHCLFVDRPFGDGALQLSCKEHEPAGEAQAARNWKRFREFP